MNDRKNAMTHDIALLLMRCMLGVVFVFHGSQKLFGAFGGPGIEGFSQFLGSIGAPLPMVGAVLAGSAEFFGGIFLALGLLTRLSVVPMVFTMLVASFAVHGSAFSIQQGGMEYSLTLAVFLAALGISGAGALSVDRVLSKRRKLLMTEAPEKIRVGTAA